MLYFGSWQLGEKADLCPKANHPSIDQGTRAFKGEFQGYIDGGKGLHTETAASAVTVILKLVMQWSDQHPVNCFTYS